MSYRFQLVAAVHLFLVKDQRILLLRRFNTGYEDGNYSVPAGHLDGHETATAAMCRETKEEANLIVEPHDLKLAHIMHRLKPPEATYQERVDFFFTTITWQGKSKIMEPNKCDDLSWFPVKKLSRNMVPYVRFAVRQYLRGNIYSEYGWKKEP